jgi:hypothetical protein
MASARSRIQGSAHHRFDTAFEARVICELLQPCPHRTAQKGSIINQFKRVKAILEERAIVLAIAPDLGWPT